MTEPDKKPGRNEPCPCGSGRKFKHCHEQIEAQEKAAATASGGGAVEIGVETEIRRTPRMTMCEREADGLKVAFVVINGGQPELQTFLVGAQGKKIIQDAVNGGIEIANPGDISKPENLL